MKDPWRSPIAGAALIVVLTIVTYLPALHCGFIWDDDDHLTNNSATVSVDGLIQIWSSPRVSRYYPLTLTSFWVQRHLWGLNPLPYHAVNIALQAVNALLVWVLLRRLLVPGAWLAAALWAVHPVNAESVAWVTELKNTQSGLFFLLALLAFLRFEEGMRGRDYALALVCGAAAMLSKPSTVVLPAVALLCVWWRRGRWTGRDLLRAAPLAAFGLGMSLLTILEQRWHVTGEGVSEWTLSNAQRSMLAGRAVWFYAGKLVWPWKVCFIYPRWELPVHSVAAWLPLAGLLLGAGMLWRFRRAAWARAATFGLGYFLVALLPVLGLFDIYFFRYSFVADHFQYLAGIGLIALIVGVGVTMCRRIDEPGRRIAIAASVALLVVLASITWRQVHVYRNLETLWRDTLAKNPGCWLAHQNLGTVLLRAGKTKEAIGQYEQALRFKPDPTTEQDYNLGSALLETGRINDAIRHFQRTLQLNPNHAEAHNNLGDALLQAGQVEGAIGHLQEALRLQPNIAEAHYNLGNAFLRVGRLDDATAQYEQALQIRPDYPEAHYNLGLARERAGKPAEAIQHYEQALQLKPDFTEARNALARLQRLPSVQ